MTRLQRAGSLEYPLGRSATRSVARARTWTWPTSLAVALLAATTVAGICLFYVWQGTAIRNLTAQKESTRATLASIQEVNRWLEVEIESAFSLERVLRLAQDRLHMIEPTDIRYVRLVPDPQQP